jgi:hypothetical protein
MMTTLLVTIIHAKSLLRIIKLCLTSAGYLGSSVIIRTPDPSIPCFNNELFWKRFSDRLTEAVCYSTFEQEADIGRVYWIS